MTSPQARPARDLLAQVKDVDLSRHQPACSLSRARAVLHIRGFVEVLRDQVLRCRRQIVTGPKAHNQGCFCGGL